MPQKLRQGLLDRGWSLARATVRAGRFAVGGKLGHIEGLVKELGQLKGSAMKVGQTLSLYGEALFPKEVNEILKTLQQRAEPLSWSVIQMALLNELGEEKLSELEIEEKPHAAASIGQVHRARVRSTGEELALKIQYPGIEQAIESDMKLLKVILAVPGMFPGKLRLDHVLSEIRDMFMQEIDYTLELGFINQFQTHLGDDPRYKLPKTYPRYSSKKVLALEFLNGVRADSPEAQSLSQERRNRIGQSFFELYLRELLDFKLVQTDPHLGNYLIQISPDDEGIDRLVLFDFGAMRAAPEEFLKHYQQLIYGGVCRLERYIERGGRGLNLLQPDDSLKLIDDYTKLCFLLCEPFADDQPYNWGDSDLPKRVAAQVGHVAYSYKLRAPPREVIFIDRKMGGVFIFLSVLKCRWSARSTVLDALKKYRGFTE